jgi:hypothetical protein
VIHRDRRGFRRPAFLWFKNDRYRSSIFQEVVTPGDPMHDENRIQSPGLSSAILLISAPLH